MSKQQNKAKGKKTQGNQNEEDWDSILEAEISANKSLAPAPVKPNEQVVQPSIAAAAKDEEDDDDDDEDEIAGVSGDKKAADKKKKKKKAKKDKEEKKSEMSATSATGRAILLRQQALAEEELRIKKLREEEEARIKAEEEREAAAERAIEEEKERKRKAKQDKVDAQKAAGTYMTKAEKEKARKQKERLEAMMQSGNVLVAGLQQQKSSSSASSVEESETAVKVVEQKVTKKAVETPQLTAATAVEAVIATKEPKAVPVSTAAADIPDEWDAAGDDWESSGDNIAARVNGLVLVAASQTDKETDELDSEGVAAQQRLRVLGQERAKRDEEARIKREAEERDREELLQKEREVAMRKEVSRKRRVEREAAARASRSPLNLRSPISCIMGHVDTGKTKLLDKIRHTNVQEGEAGGITQQIGATQFSKDTLYQQTQCMQSTAPFDIKLPGLLVIDTPGHESFTNLRTRGSSLCDIAILVIDLMHGLEPQTIESLNMLRRRKCPFVVALNKVDRCYGWKTMPDSPIRAALAAQDENCRLEFKDRASRAILQLNEQGLNACMYWENDDPLNTISLVPTSAMTGEGVPDLLYNLITLTQDLLREQLMFMEYVQCTVLEVKTIDGLGFTVDVVLLNGTLHEGDSIVVSTMEGPVVTSIRALLTPPPNREMRIKSEYIHHASLQGAIGIKIVAPDIARAIAGTPLMVVHADDDLEELKEDCQSDLSKVMKSLETDSRGVMVHASTLGALEALLQFLREETKPPIPVSHISIGPIYKKDVMRANIMNEKGQPEYATILAFDVRVDAEAAAMAEELKVRIFTAEIIYHLFDQFTAYMRGLTEARRAAAEALAVHPCVLKIMPQHIFNKKDPIVFGVEVVEGTLKLGTPLYIPSLSLDVGRVTSIENNHKEVTAAKKASTVSIKITNESNPTLTYGRQFDHTHALYSKLSRNSIDALKEFFKDDVSKEDWALVVKLKKVMNIS